ncbi:MAG: chloramphenicol acetyltransferase [Ruminococcus sp.]|nr:chloramphenicol acetyltransferase [Ruminococcus sp.]
MSENKNSSCTIIDVDNWDRKEHFYAFRNMVDPCNTITFELDITNFYNMVKRKKLSFTLAMVYASAKCAREVEAFRYRFLNGKVVLYNDLKTRFSYKSPEDKYFRTIEAPLKDTLEEYITSARISIEKQKFTFPEPEGYDYVYCASNPFISYTSISHTLTGNESDAVPLLGWGKFFTRNDRIIIPYTLKTNHCFVDGSDYGVFVNKLVQYIEEC